MKLRNAQKTELKETENGEDWRKLENQCKTSNIKLIREKLKRWEITLL